MEISKCKCTIKKEVSHRINLNIIKNMIKTKITKMTKIYFIQKRFLIFFL